MLSADDTTSLVVFAAATVLIGVRQFGSPDTTLTEAEFQYSWGRVLAILQYHEPQIQSARQGVQILEALIRRIVEAKTRSDSLSCQNDYGDRSSPSLPLYRFEDFDSLSSAWFTQQITDLDFLDVI